MTPYNKPTRGKTTHQRLALLDSLLTHLVQTKRWTPPHTPPLRAVDIGFGEYPYTSIDLARTLQHLTPDLTPTVHATELDPKRIENAQRLPLPDNLVIHSCGFELTPALHKHTHLLRAANILRQHNPNDIPEIHTTLLQHLAPHGLLLEGTCDRLGHLGGFHIFTPQHPTPHSILFLFSPHNRSFAPRMLRDWLPQRIRRAVRPNTNLHQLFDDWTQAWTTTRTTPLSPFDSFTQSAQTLSAHRHDIDASLSTHGYLLWNIPYTSLPTPLQNN